MSYVHYKRIIPVIIALVILVLSLLPHIPAPPVSFNAMDKVEHLLAYAVLAYFTLYALETSRVKGLVFLCFITVAVCTVYGGIIEIAQSFTGRYSEWLDLAADGAGSAAGAFTACASLKFLKQPGRRFRQ